ncbi:MAG: crotonase/enoyl-CoA hydratase family protein [Myxococcota bacterium]
MGRLSYTIDDQIATIRLDDGKANALGPEMLGEINEALDRTEKEAKALIITGREDRFCAGFDLKVMMKGPEAARDLFVAGGRMMLRVYLLPMPVVIASTGHAVAGGALMLLVGDTRIGVRGDFKVGLNEVAIKMTLPVFAQELARSRLDPRRLTEAALQARMYNPDEAVEVGYLDRTSDVSKLMKDAEAEARRLAELPLQAYAATKTRLRRPTVKEIEATMEEDMAAMAEGR